ncbi:MAG: acetyltransferase [Acidimicrobiales bacterium]|nr:MAG: acetyltransferase [Acidimicrobiales bacterium]
MAIPDQEWGTEKLAVDAYLARIGYHGELAPGGETLRRLHRAHLAAIPFENLDIQLGRPLPLGLPSLEDKMIRHRRGGYCYEHNLLFAALAERLGYPVNRFLGRVNRGDDHPGPLTHMTLVVQADGVSWLADVGFGAGILEPIPLTDGATVAQDGWTYRLERHDGHWRLGTLGPDGWSELYRFTQEHQHRVDYEVANHYTATHPDSVFVGKMVVMRTQPDAKHRLIGQELTTTRADGTSERQIVGPDELIEVLVEVFGIELEPDDGARLAGQLRGHHNDARGRTR